MNSWVYLFSRFTPEALLVEALAICGLTAWYAAYWVLRKRRLGVIQTAVPASVVKHHLNELIAEAERLRAQLFGLLTSGSTPAEIAELRAAMKNLAPAAVNAEIRPAPGIPEAIAAQVSAADSALAAKIVALEQKISEQIRVIHTITLEKGKLEQRLAAAASGAPAGADSAGEFNAELLEKVRNLEAKLAEYSVIEDDLANLKRLQQENAQLKTALATKASASTAALEPAAPEPASGSEAVAADDGQAPSLDSAATVAEIPPETPAQASKPEPVSSVTTDQFEGLVNEVEKSLQTSQEETAASDVQEESAPIGRKSESDEELVAEFEKLLNG